MGLTRIFLLNLQNSEPEVSTAHDTNPDGPSTSVVSSSRLVLQRVKIMHASGLQSKPHARRIPKRRDPT